MSERGGAALFGIYLAGLAAAGAVLLLALGIPSAAAFGAWWEAIRAGRPLAGGEAALWSSAVLLMLLGFILVGLLEAGGRLDRFRGWRRVFFSLLLSLGPPLAVFTLFEAEGPRAVLVGVAVGINLLHFAAAVGAGSTFSDAMRRLIYIVSAAIIVSGLVITPLSAYLAWFDILQGTGTGGLIPFVFSLVTGLFTVAFGSAVYRRGYLLPAAGCAAVTSLVGAVVLQSALLGAIGLASGMAALILLFRDSFVVGRLRDGGLRSPLFGLALALLLALPAALATEVKGSAAIDEFVSPWIKNRVTALMPDFPFLYSMPGYGFKMNEKRLGGRPALSEQAIFRIEGPPGETLYLRTRVFDAYTGQGWGISEGLLKQVEREQKNYFSTRRTGDDISIEVLIDFTNTLPHTLGLSHFRSRAGYELTYGSLETGFILENPILRGETVVVERRQGRVDSPSLSPYLAIPASLPSEVRQLAARLGAGLRGEPEKILANIVTYLAENNSYSLDVGYADAAVDSTWDFLFNSRTGYCTNFATAYVILARLNGIPARYATGFLVFMPFDDGETFVTGYGSHAWPEVYLEERGWVAREATPPMNPDFMEEYFYYGEYGGGMSESTSRQLERMLGDRAPEETAAPAARGGRSAAFLLPLLAGAAAALALLLLKRPLSALMPLHDPRARAQRELSGIVRSLREPGIPSPQTSGWVRWSRETVRRRGRREAVLIRRVTHIALRGFFSPRAPELRDIRFLRLARRRFRRR